MMVDGLMSISQHVNILYDINIKASLSTSTVFLSIYNNKLLLRNCSSKFIFLFYDVTLFTAHLDIISLVHLIARAV